MCAIAGAFPYKAFNIEKLQKALLHRGVDEQNHLILDNIAFLHNRLAIVDIEQGKQPFVKEGCLLLFNGEIYNHKELRQTYLSEFTFTTQSDTETLLYMYKKFQSEMFKYIDGMFAFVVFDIKQKKLFFARDRAGKKPLYLYKKGKEFVFASELVAIKKVVPSLAVFESSIQSYLRNGFIYGSYTPYKDVIELEAGHHYSLDLQSFALDKKEYFSLLKVYEQPKQKDYNSAKDYIETILHTSIKQRLLSSDVEVGAFLSGGIDSSLIVAIASQYKQQLQTFTVKFSKGFDESFLAKQTAKRYNTNHHELSISMNLQDDIETILQSYGEPFMDSSAIPSYYVSKEARKYVKVVLNGDGADEIFGGYRRYVAQSHPIFTNMHYLSSIVSVLPKPHTKSSYYTYLYRLLTLANKNGLAKYNSAVNDIFEDYYTFEDNPIFNQMEQCIESVEKNSALSSLDKALYLDSLLLLRNDLLKKMDIASMQFSLEARSPFLSKEMLSYTPTLADNFKIKGFTTKYILRDIAQDYLDKNLIQQPKRGFEVPLQQWVNEDLHDIIFDSLHNQSYVTQFMEWNFVQKILEKKIDISDVKRAKMIWTLFALEMWKKVNG